MKKIFVLAVLSLCFTACCHINMFEGDTENYKFEVNKQFEKTFEVGEVPILEMIGKYSDFIISSWDEQRIDFSVKITVKGNDEKKVNERLNTINIMLKQVDNKVIAQTLLDKYPYKQFSGSISVKYYVQVPRDVFMNLATIYGDIIVETVEKKFNVDIKYGDLIADSLLDDSHIDITYGDFAVNYAKLFNVELTYAKGKVKQCDYINGILKYTDIDITKLSCGSLENMYSDVLIKEVDNVKFGNNQYTNIDLKNVTEKLEAALQYSNIEAMVSANEPNIEITGQYSNLNLTLNENASFNYNLQTQYGKIKTPFVKESKGLSIGYYGNSEQTSGNINIKLQYGDIKINE